MSSPWEFHFSLHNAHSMQHLATVKKLGGWVAPVCQASLQQVLSKISRVQSKLKALLETDGIVNVH